MKKVSSILMIILVLLSSLHVTVATHFCGGHISNVKVGLEGTRVSCGMETNSLDKTNSFAAVSTHCCENTSNDLSVDNFQTSPSLQIQKSTLNLLQVFIAPVLHILYESPLKSFSFADGGFHHLLLSLSERLTFICVFRK